MLLKMITMWNLMCISPKFIYFHLIQTDIHTQKSQQIYPLVVHFPNARNSQNSIQISHKRDTDPLPSTMHISWKLDQKADVVLKQSTPAT